MGEGTQRIDEEIKRTWREGEATGVTATALADPDSTDPDIVAAHVAGINCIRPIAPARLVIGRPPSEARSPRGKPEPAVPSVIAITASNAAVISMRWFVVRGSEPDAHGPPGTA